MIPGLQMIEKTIRQKIVDELDKVGILYRIFIRIKNDKSIIEKINRKKIEGKPYDKNGKKIQDIIGARIVTYFRDDVDVVKNILNSKFNFLDEEIDEPELTVFKPKRTNIICAFDDDQIQTLKEITTATDSYYELIDCTFELQLRTMLSEGWHEIDHNLRYKCKKDWANHKESERLLNGLYASLETSDIALKNLFNELSYQHFRDNNWEALLRNKFRLQFEITTINENLIVILNDNNAIGKQILKIDRNAFLLKISCIDLSLPVNFNNLIYLLNILEIQDEKIMSLTPQIIKSVFED